MFDMLQGLPTEGISRPKPSGSACDFPAPAVPALEVFILCPDKLSVIVPYEDFAELLSLKDRFLEIERNYKQLQKQYTAIMKIYSEILDKVSEIERYL